MADSVSQAIGGDQFFSEQIDPEIPFDPDVITVAYGTNDWAIQKDEKCIANAEKYFARLREIYPDKHIIYFQPIYRMLTAA